MISQLSSAYGKLRRAGEHIANIKTCLSGSVFNVDKYELLVETEPDGLHEALRIRHSVTAVPDNIVATIGDAVHNLRSSLDHLACAMALHNDPSVVIRNVSFLIRDTKSNFENRDSSKKLNILGAEGVKFMRGLKPYGDCDGITLFHTLSALDNTDKHRTLLTTSIYSAGLIYNGPGTLETIMFQPSKATWERLDKSGVLVARWPTGEKPVIDQIMNVAFDEPHVPDKQPVLSVLNNMHGLVEWALWAAESEISW